MVDIKLKSLIQAIKYSMKDRYIKAAPLFRVQYQALLDNKFGEEDKVEAPDFWSKNVNILDVPKCELENAYIEVSGNLGNKEAYYFILIGIEAVGITSAEPKIELSFISTMTKWPASRVVIMSPDGSKIYRNDFQDVGDRRDSDKRHDIYQKAENKSKAPALRAPKQPTIRRPNLTKT